MDCSGDLPPGVTINSVVSVLPDQATTPPLVCAAPTINPAPLFFAKTNTTAPALTCITVVVSGGVDTPTAAPYLIRFLYNGSDGNQYESIGYLAVCDFPPVEFRSA
jgi:hypothetical protein